MARLNGGSAKSRAAARKVAMDRILKLREGSTPHGRCAVLAGVSKDTLRTWLRQGEQLAIAAGELDPSIIEGSGIDVELPKTKTAQDQVRQFALSWWELERSVEPGHIANIVRCAGGYVQRVKKTKRIWVKGKGKRPGRWVNAEQTEEDKVIPADWRASLHLLQMNSPEWRMGVSISGALRLEVEAMTEEELRAELMPEMLS
jgi:hypothetical protein